MKNLTATVFLIVLVLLTVSVSAEPISPHALGFGIWTQIVQTVEAVTSPLIAAVESVTAPEPEESEDQAPPPPQSSSTQECGTPQECIDQEAPPRIDPWG